jgi:hypothetical protein
VFLEGNRVQPCFFEAVGADASALLDTLVLTPHPPGEARPETRGGGEG